MQVPTDPPLFTKNIATRALSRCQIIVNRGARDGKPSRQSIFLVTLVVVLFFLSRGPTQSALTELTDPLRAQLSREIEGIRTRRRGSYFFEHLAECLPSTESVNINIERGPGGDVLITAMAKRCTRFHNSGCNTTWSVNALLSDFSKLPIARKEGDDTLLFSTLKKQTKHKCMQPGEPGDQIPKLYESKRKDSVCMVTEAQLSSRRSHSCAVVGSAPQDGKHANDIDSPTHDLVFRYNLINNVDSSSGTRADVWILNNLAAAAGPYDIERTGFNYHENIGNAINGTLLFHQALNENSLSTFMAAQHYNATKCRGKFIINPEVTVMACFLADGAISTGQIGLFLAAAMCEKIDAYGFTLLKSNSSRGNAYTHSDGIDIQGETVDNIFLLQFTFNTLLHCLKLVTFHS